MSHFCFSSSKCVRGMQRTLVHRGRVSNKKCVLSVGVGGYTHSFVLFTVSPLTTFFVRVNRSGLVHSLEQQQLQGLIAGEKNPPKPGKLTSAAGTFLISSSPSHSCLSPVWLPLGVAVPEGAGAESQGNGG